MSRHRFVRNIDIHDELDDDHHEYDDPLEGISAEHQHSLDTATAVVMGVIGAPKDSLVTEEEVRRMLWDNYFDADETAVWALAEKEKRVAAKLKREEKARAQQSASKPNTPKKPVGGSKSGTSTPLKSKPQTPSTSIKIGASPTKPNETSQLRADLEGLNIGTSREEEEDLPPPPKMTLSREKVLEEAKRGLDTTRNGVKKSLSVVIIGHVDAGKSTLMGRLTYELGQMEEKRRRENERESSKAGKSSFKWAWEMDAMAEERERGVTIDINQSTLNLPRTNLTILDAPGHRDFVPNMISGAAQADAALLVVDATTGEFEAGFAGGGQSREHVVLVRSLGVSSIVVAVNKLDMVNYSQERFDEIVGALRPFLIQSGYIASKITFVPCAGMAGVNLCDRESPGSELLQAWWTGGTLVEALDDLPAPGRAIDAALRIPVANVFKGVLAGLGVSGKISSGVVQVGETLRVLPGDESGVVRSIEVEDAGVPWAAAGSNATLYLSGVDPINLSVGSILCTAASVIPTTTSFTAQIIVFDIAIPIMTGSAVELFHHSRDYPAVVGKLISLIDRSTGAELKASPRMLASGASGRMRVDLRSANPTASSKPIAIPLEPFSVNKDMGRILLRRKGETIAAGIVLKLNA